MAFITSKVILAVALIACAGGEASIMGYQAYRSDAHSAIANMAVAPSQAPAGPDWSRQWYENHRAIHDNAADAVAVPTF